MGQLRALQEELRTLLPIGQTKTESAFWKDGLPARLQVYRNTVHGNGYDTLDADYPLTKKQFSDDNWFELSEAFFKKYPPRYFELNHCIFSFPKFLKQKKVSAFLVELADYELADLEAFIDPGEVKKGSGVSNPTVRTRVFHYQLFDWVAAKADPMKRPKQKPEVLVFYRDTTHTNYVREADPLMLLLLDHYRRPGAQLADAEPLRKRLLPANKVDLRRVLDELVASDLVLL